MQPTALTRTHRVLIGVVVAGAVLIAAVGFAGSYSAVRDLAERKDFGWFAAVFPLGIDAGIVVLLALDLLLTWIRIPFPLLRQTAWLLTTATVAFNGAAAWPDPLGVGMHATIPLLFITTVEAARHAIGRIADITADRHMEGVRLTRWLLAPAPTFKLWRRMKLWELRSYDHALALERDRLVYKTRLRARHGRTWRRTAPPDALLALKLAKYGVPVPQDPADTRQEPARRPRPRPEPEHPAGQVPPSEPATVPVGPGRRRALSSGQSATEAPTPTPAPAPEAVDTETAFEAFCDYTDRYGRHPSGNELAQHIQERIGDSGRGRVTVSPMPFRRHLPDFERRYPEARGEARREAQREAGSNGRGPSLNVPKDTFSAGPTGHTSPDPMADVR